MTEVRKIREGVFLVSWTSNNPSCSRGEPSAANVTFEEISQSCRLFFKSSGQDDYEGILEIEMSRVPSTKNETNLQTLRLERVLAIKDGNKQSMTLQNSIWTAQFPELCCCGNRLLAVSKFEILLEFRSKPMNTKHVMNHLMNLWETKTLTDVTFKFKEKEVKAHMLIVASGSPVLAAMFQNDFKEKQERVVVIEDAQSTVFEKMLRFFYTGDAILDMDVPDLLILTNKYGVDSLKEECSLYMAENLTVDSVIPCLILSHLHEAPNLKQSTLEFISQNSLAIVSKKEWADLMKNHHEIGLTALQKIVFTLNQTIETQKETQKEKKIIRVPLYRN